ncbi:MAG: phosphatidylserine decarboxylase family protein [Flavobacteriales bacterium]|nr:phosphatidylserine decarboxylase family protein [Flavobacteriales bacterium]
MKLHKEGYQTLINELIIILVLAYFTFSNSSVILEVFLLFMLFIFIITLNFFRIPKRSFERKEGVIYAPCDGKVVVIEETKEKEYFNDNRIQVSVFMSPLNVHNNLYPISGDIMYKKYHPGKFLFAWNPKASTDNERSTIVIKNNNISILCRQIAGALARRIVTYSKIKETYNCSDELGFIKFGSRVDLFLPIGTKINTKIGDKVIGGQSILATY